MPLLSLTLAPEAVGKLHDVLVCLGKFSESVSLEAHSNKLILSALNLSKSAYASFTFDGTRFFARYQFASSQATSSQTRDGAQPHFTCQLHSYQSSEDGCWMLERERPPSSAVSSEFKRALSEPNVA